MNVTDIVYSLHVCILLIPTLFINHNVEKRKNIPELFLHISYEPHYPSVCIRPYLLLRFPTAEDSSLALYKNYGDPVVKKKRDLFTIKLISLTNCHFMIRSYMSDNIIIYC